MEEAAAVKPTWGKRLLRYAISFTAMYLGVLVVLLLMETRLIFHPTPASRFWNPPPDERFRDITISTADGNTIHAWWLPVDGARSATLYSHGNAGNLSARGVSMVKFSKALNSSVLIYDYPGYGRSTGSPTEASCQASAAAAWHWLTTGGGFEPKRVQLVGISLGGAMAIELARRHDHRALIVVKSFTSIPDMAQARFPWLPARYLVRTRFNNLSKIVECKRPVFIHHSRADELVPFAQGQCLFDAAKPPKEFHTAERDVHDASLPAEFFQRLRAFLDEHAPVD